MARFPVAVHCHAGYRGEETPRCFMVGEASIRVEEVLRRWTEPTGRGFRVRGDDGILRTLWWDQADDRWHLLCEKHA